jgi:peptidoglycan/LPS O-acetylase OafA/YrhL
VGLQSDSTRFDELLIGWSVLPVGPARDVRASASLLPALRPARRLAILLWKAIPKEPAMLQGGLLTCRRRPAGVLIADIVARPAGWLARAFGREPLVGIGRISYGLYLWHFPIVYSCGALIVDGTRPDLPRAALAIGLTFAAAIASFRWVERPMLRLKRRFGP